jgi:hypothetical protein
MKPFKLFTGYGYQVYAPNAYFTPTMYNRQTFEPVKGVFWQNRLYRFSMRYDEPFIIHRGRQIMIPTYQTTLIDFLMENYSSTNSTYIYDITFDSVTYDCTNIGQMTNDEISLPAMIRARVINRNENE